MLQVADKTYWSKIIKTREILTHHYIDIDTETIYDICNEKLDELENKVLEETLVVFSIFNFCLYLKKIFIEIIIYNNMFC